MTPEKLAEFLGCPSFVIFLSETGLMNTPTLQDAQHRYWKKIM